MRITYLIFNLIQNGRLGEGTQNCGQVDRRENLIDGEGNFFSFFFFAFIIILNTAFVFNVAVK